MLAALVLDMSRVAHRPALLGPPCSVMTYTGGFVLEGALRAPAGEVLADLRTDATWKVAVDTGHRFQNENTTFEGYLGYFEHRVSRLIPEGWNTPSSTTPAWPAAHVLFKAERLENRRDPASPYGLMPRLVPTGGRRAGDVCRRVPRGRRCGVGRRRALLQRGTPLTLAPHETVTVVLDATKLTTAFPRIEVSGGAGSEIRLTYAEALRLAWNTPGAKLFGRQQSLANLASHFSDESRGWTFHRRGQVTGWCDIWEPSGRDEAFEPLHWRAFRYIGLRVRAGAAPLTLRAARAPLHGVSLPRGGDAPLVGPRARPHLGSGPASTMWMCSHETFEDCPHYEQMQYAGDTMITSKSGCSRRATTG